MNDCRWIRRLDGQTLPDKALIGGKAWSVARMCHLGLPVPPAFVVTTDACRAFLQNGEFPEQLDEELDAGIAWLEALSGRQFGHRHLPLLVSVRSGAVVSMPGMMDTVLNLGINAETEAGLREESGLHDFARNTHCRFLELYAAIVLKTPLGEVDRNADPGHLYARLRSDGVALPDSVREQLRGAVRAVFESWNSRRARRYRDHHTIPHDLGTAVTVQAMVFGNLDANSGTGVIFSRNPIDGSNAPYGEYLPQAQGEDVVSGRFTPLSLAALAAQAPAAHAALLRATAQLEREHGDVQDIEFTVQRGSLYLLQARAAKRAPHAAVRIAVEMVDEGRIDIATALSRVTPEQVQSILLPRLHADALATTAAPIASGEGACPGVGVGVVVDDPDDAERRAAAGEDVVLLRTTTSPEDVHGMIAARAVITEQGGSTSHAAVVSRALGRPCVVGVGMNPALRAATTVTVDGAAGRVYSGALPVDTPRESEDEHLRRLIEWARERSPVRVLRFDEADPALSCVKVDGRVDSADQQAVVAALAGIEHATGVSLASPAIARFAALAGVRTLVTEPILPALLAIVGGAA